MTSMVALIMTMVGFDYIHVHCSLRCLYAIESMPRVIEVEEKIWCVMIVLSTDPTECIMLVRGNLVWPYWRGRFCPPEDPAPWLPEDVAWISMLPKCWCVSTADFTKSSNQLNSWKLNAYCNESVNLVWKFVMMKLACWGLERLLIRSMNPS